MVLFYPNVVQLKENYFYLFQENTRLPVEWDFKMWPKRVFYYYLMQIRERYNRFNLLVLGEKTGKERKYEY